MTEKNALEHKYIMYIMYVDVYAYDERLVAPCLQYYRRTAFWTINIHVYT